jgi:hypothetical protein
MMFDCGTWRQLRYQLARWSNGGDAHIFDKDDAIVDVAITLPVACAGRRVQESQKPTADGIRAILRHAVLLRWLAGRDP